MQGLGKGLDAAVHCSANRVTGQNRGCTGALHEELSLINVLLCLAGDSLRSQASCPGSLKGQVKPRIEGNCLDFTLLIH